MSSFYANIELNNKLFGIWNSMQTSLQKHSVTSANPAGKFNNTFQTFGIANNFAANSPNNTSQLFKTPDFNALKNIFDGMNNFKCKTSVFPANSDFNATGMNSLSGNLSNCPGKNVSGKYANLINKYAAKYGLNPAFVKAIIKCESDFNPRCTSDAGAKGLMQLMPCNYGNSNPYDPEQNINLGCREIKGYLKTYNGDLKAALACYNAGQGRYKRYINGRSSLPKETQRYIPRVLATYEKYRSEGI